MVCFLVVILPHELRFSIQETKANNFPSFETITNEIEKKLNSVLLILLISVCRITLKSHFKIKTLKKTNTCPLKNP